MCSSAKLLYGFYSTDLIISIHYTCNNSCVLYSCTEFIYINQSITVNIKICYFISMLFKPLTCMKYSMMFNLCCYYMITLILKNYIITSISFARNLFGQQGMLSDLEIRLKPGSNLDAVKAEMQQIAGNKYKVLDRFEQQEDTFKIMSIEKMIAYIFLTFILVVACFNIIGSLSMLIIDKKNDVVTLRNLGANDKQITRVFLFEGRMIAVIGAVIGIGLGLLLCFLQQQYGFVRLGDSEGSFIVDAYPVSVHYSDVAIIFVTVIAVGWLAVWYPVRALSKRLLS